MCLFLFIRSNRAAIPPILINPGLASVFGCGLIFGTGVLYGMMSLGKKYVQIVVDTLYVTYIKIIMLHCVVVHIHVLCEKWVQIRKWVILSKRNCKVCHTHVLIVAWLYKSIPSHSHTHTTYIRIQRCDHNETMYIYILHPIFSLDTYKILLTVC